MKVMVLTGIREMEMRELPDPRIERQTDVLLKVGAVGVCGSDVHYYAKGKIGDMVVQYPFAVGHEFGAIVEEVGTAVTRVQPGDRVAVDPAISCGTCQQCLSGRPHTCLNLRFLGCPGQAEGCLSEYIVMPQECCYAIKPDTTLDQAALAEPLSIGVYAVRFLEGKNVRSIGILGAGPIGLSVMLVAREAGYDPVFVTDKIDARLRVAANNGAGWVGNPDTSDVVQGIQAKEPDLLDAIFECCGDQDALDQAIDLLKPGGTLLIIGIPPADRVSFDISKIRKKEITIQNVRRQNDCVQAAIETIESGDVSVGFLITHRFGLEETRDAFELVADYKDGAVKAMIEFD